MTYATFDDWIYEVEGFGLRAERAAEDLGPNWKPWLETAWGLGVEAEREACAMIADCALSVEDGFTDDLTTAESIAAAIRARSTPGSAASTISFEMQRDRMESAGCLAIDALKALRANGALSDAQRAMIEGALTAMFDAKERWHSNPAAARNAGIG